MIPELEKYKIEEINDIYVLMSIISLNMFEMPRMYYSRNKGILELRGESISAVENTVKSIEFCCLMGHFADAYTLLRKYRDDVMQYLYITSVMASFRNMNEEEAIKYEAENKEELDAIALWLKNELNVPEQRKLRKDYFDASKYKKNLMKNPTVKILFQKYLEGLWKKVDRVLNDYVHTNGRGYVLQNYGRGEKYLNKRKQLIMVLREITSILIAVLAFIDPYQLRSSDYVDALDMGLEPDPDSVTWVMPGVVNHIDKYFPKIHPDLIDFIEENNQAEFHFKKSYYDY